MALVGFKRMTIRVLDGEATPTLGKNLFVVEGKTGEGATRTAKITGLSSEPVKTYGSDVAYYTSKRGVGDVKMEMTAVDIPHMVLAKILGHVVKDEIIYIGEDSDAPLCSVMLESKTANGTKAQVGFFKGSFSMDAEELESLKEKQEELPDDSLSSQPLQAMMKKSKVITMVSTLVMTKKKSRNSKGNLKWLLQGRKRAQALFLSFF